MGSTVRPARQRNARGQGGRLRDEIITGAAALLERTGSEESVTLRAVAREIGITAPSIAPHFSDRTEIIDAVVSRELHSLHAALASAAASQTDPVERVLASARAYVAHGRENPNRYRIVFERRFLDVWATENKIMEQTAPLGAETFDLIVRTLQECIDAGRSASTDAFADAVAAWLALHGLVALPQAITSFPWPDTDDLIVTCISRLTRLTAERERRVRDTT